MPAASATAGDFSGGDLNEGDNEAVQLKSLRNVSCLNEELGAVFSAKLSLCI